MLKKHRSNMAKLIAYADQPPALPVAFDMGEFAYDADNEKFVSVPAEYACGTVACFAGLAPWAGIKPRDENTWAEYVLNNFGVSLSERDGVWLFSLCWKEYDNTLAGAVTRAKHYLESGVPESFDHALGANWERTI